MLRFCPAGLAALCDPRPRSPGGFLIRCPGSTDAGRLDQMHGRPAPDRWRRAPRTPGRSQGKVTDCNRARIAPRIPGTPARKLVPFAPLACPPLRPGRRAPRAALSSHPGRRRRGRPPLPGCVSCLALVLLAGVRSAVPSPACPRGQCARRGRSCLAPRFPASRRPTPFPAFRRRASFE